MTYGLDAVSPEGQPAYGSPVPPPPPGVGAISQPALDPVKAHAAYCAARLLAGEAERMNVSEYDVSQMCEAFEKYLRGR